MLSQILVNYITFVRPFAAVIASYTLGPDAMHEYLYRIFTCEGEPLTTENFSSTLSLMTSPSPADGGVGMSLTVSTWRQLSTAIWHSDSFFPRIQHLISASDNDLVPDLQAGHCSRIANNFYGRFANRLPNLDLRLMAMFVEVSNQYISYFRLEREVPTDIQSVIESSSQATTNSTDTTENSSTSCSVQSIINSAYTDAFVSRLISSLTPIIITSARESAAQSAAVLRNALPTTGNGVLIVDSANDIDVSFSILGTLWVHMGDDKARFRSPEQAQAVQYALEKRGNLLVVLPTGGGKSLIFLLPMIYDKLASCPSVNVLIVPYNAMKEDMCRRCLESGLSAALFDSNMTVEDIANLDCLICVADTVANPRFHTVLRTLQALGFLARIYIDEAHHVLCSNVFRPVFTLLYQLRSYSVPLILLSATMPPGHVQDLMVSLSISSLKVIRRPSWRPELYIAVTRLPDENDPAGQLCEYVLYYQTMFPGGKVLIFCQTKQQVDDISNLVPLSSRYHSDMSHIEQTSSMFSFLNDEDPCLVMVATSVLGNGFDIDNMPVVLHYGIPYSMTSYMQESGRAARNGSNGVSHVFVLGPENDSPCIYDGVNLGIDVIRSWVSTEQPCRRSLPHKVMDDNPITCACLPSAVFCDICRLSQSILFQPSVDGQDPDECVISTNPMTTAYSQYPNTSNDAIILEDQTNVASPSPLILSPVDPDLPSSSRSPILAQMPILVDCHMHLLQVGINDEDRKSLKAILQTLKDKKLCIICWAKGGNASKHKPAFSCVHAHFFGPSSGFKLFRESIHFSRGTCYYCGMPQVCYTSSISEYVTHATSLVS
jgi:hypothetical protein